MNNNSFIIINKMFIKIAAYSDREVNCWEEWKFWRKRLQCSQSLDWPPGMLRLAEAIETTFPILSRWHEPYYRIPKKTEWIHCWTWPCCHLDPLARSPSLVSCLVQQAKQRCLCGAIGAFFFRGASSFATSGHPLPPTLLL